jgi:magnesium transporter
MTRLMKKHSMAKGLEPGRVIFIGKQKVEKPIIRVINYNESSLEELEVDSPLECLPCREKSSVTWMNIDGLHDVSIIEKIGEHFGVHSLLLEDITNTGQRPKLEISDDSIFLTLKMLYLEESEKHLVSEQFSFLIGVNYVISFQERVGDVFEPVRRRLRKSKSRSNFIRPDYLGYTLIDSIVDNYFVVLEDIAAQIEQVEDAVIERPDPADLATIHDLKRQLILMRKATWPLREVIGGLERSDSPLIDPTTRLFLRDLYEHTVQVIDTVEIFREMVSGLLDIYLSSLSNRMNEVMKVLTIIATIFIPLGFLAGVYGMNFDTSVSPFNMPELSFRYGYLIFWGVALLIGGGLFTLFKKKRWI